MDSINLFRGYGKVDSLESVSHPSQTNRRRLKIAALCFVFLPTLLIGVLIGALIYESTHGTSEEDNPRLSTNSSEVIQAVCAVTRHPHSCFSAISSSSRVSIPPDPLFVFVLSLEVAEKEVSRIYSLIPKKLSSLVNDSPTGSALSDCSSLMDDAASQLGSCKQVIRERDGKKKTRKKIEDLKTWISAAMTDEQTCVDGLEEINSSMAGNMKFEMLRSTEYMSNCLAILANLEDLLHRFNLQLD